MLLQNKHLILIGFKHTGKTKVGRLLAKTIAWPFRDLDKAIEESYQTQYAGKYSCREIYQNHGEIFFRKQEYITLSELMSSPCFTVISLGGGAPLTEANQRLIQQQLIVDVTAPEQIVFQRIMKSGKPAFFPENEDPESYFERLWNQRQKVYQQLAHITVDNGGAVADTVAMIIKKLEKSS